MNQQKSHFFQWTNKYGQSGYQGRPICVFFQCTIKYGHSGSQRRAIKQSLCNTISIHQYRFISVSIKYSIILISIKYTKLQAKWISSCSCSWKSINFTIKSIEPLAIIWAKWLTNKILSIFPSLKQGYNHQLWLHNFEAQAQIIYQCIKNHHYIKIYNKHSNKVTNGSTNSNTSFQPRTNWDFIQNPQWQTQQWINIRAILFNEPTSMSSQDTRKNPYLYFSKEPSSTASQDTAWEK